MSDKKDIGALWRKQGSNGEFLSGYVEIDGQRVEIVCFVNNYQKDDRHPAYKILPSQKRESKPGHNPDDVPF